MGRLLGDVHQWFHCWDLEPVVNHIDVHDFLFSKLEEYGLEKKNISNYNKNWKSLLHL